MKKISSANLMLLILCLLLMVWVVVRTPSQAVAEENLKIMISDLDFMFKNGTILSSCENAKTGAALALYDVDAATWDEKKAAALKDSLAAKGWTPAEENSHVYVMCKNKMKASISKNNEKMFVKGLEKSTYSVSMEFNAGTKDFCR